MISKTQRVKDGVVGDLVDIAWVEAAGNQRSRLLALDTSVGLGSYDTTAGRRSGAVAGRDQWGYPNSFRLQRQPVRSRYQGQPALALSAGLNGYEDAPEPYFLKAKRSIYGAALDGHRRQRVAALRGWSPAEVLCR